MPVLSRRFLLCIAIDVKIVEFPICSTGRNDFNKTLIIASIDKQNRVHLMLPYGIMGVLCLIAGGLCLILPETKGVATAETVDDNNNLHEMNANEKQRKNNVLSSEVKDDIHT